MLRLEFDIPDYLAGAAWPGLEAQHRRVALSLAQSHAKAVEGSARASAPVRSGRLRDSIRAYPIDERRGALEVSAPHAKFVHEGTGVHGPGRKPYTIKPKKKLALYWPGAGHPAKAVVHEGLKPSGFLRAAIEQSRVDAQMRMEAEAALKQLEAELAARETRHSRDAETSESDSWYDFWDWGELGEDLLRRSGNVASGFGDTVSSFFGVTGFIGRNMFDTHSWDQGLSGWARQQSGTDQYVDKCSSYYTGGTVAADIWLTALSGGIGSWRGSFFKKGMSRPNPAFPRGIEWVEGSHWIPKRLLPESLIKAEWNIKRVWGTTHALSDPFRFRFMRVKWKDANELYNPLFKHWVRMPYWMQGTSIGAVTGEGSRILRSNNHD